MVDQILEHMPETQIYLVLGLGTAPLSNSWIIIIIWLYIALNRTPNIDCYWVGAVPNFRLLYEPNQGAELASEKARNLPKAWEEDCIGSLRNPIAVPLPI